VRKTAAGLALGLGAAAVVLALASTGWLDKVELRTYDWRMRTAAALSAGSSPDPGRGEASGDDGIALVEINDASIDELAPLVGRWPWPRALMGLLVDYLRRGNPKGIALDIGFWEPEREATYPFLGEAMTSEASDRALAGAVRRAGNVVLLANAVHPGFEDRAVEPTAWNAPPYRLGPLIEPRPVIQLPYEPLASSASGFGHNFLALDPDGVARRMVPFVRHGGRYLPALGVAAALAAGGYGPDEVVLEDDGIRIRDRVIPLEPLEVRTPDGGRRIQHAMWINYGAGAHAGNVLRPYRAYEVRDLLRSEGQILSGGTPDVNPALFEGKIVFVGLTASGLLDVFQTPLGEGTLPGIQLHASVADSILSGRLLRSAPRWTAPAAVLALAILTGLMSAALPFAWAAAGALGLAAAWVAGALHAFTGGLSLAVASPVLGVALSLFGGTAYRYFVEDAEKRKVSRLFGRYVSRDVYQQLMASPGLAELGGRRREMSVLFSDIRGFTSITERGDPDELVLQLNEYFTRMVETVFRRGGTVDKFVGDMVMALFGAPVHDPAHAEHAVAAAVDMVAGLAELNAQWAAEGRPTLDIGIGINSGEMIAGNIGSSSIMSYTVIGDNVNLASRLESLNKEYGTRIIISDATRLRLETAYETRPLGGVVVKGKTRAVDIFEVRVPSPLPPAGALAGTAVEEGTS